MNDFPSMEGYRCVRDPQYTCHQLLAHIGIFDKSTFDCRIAPCTMHTVLSLCSLLAMIFTRTLCLDARQVSSLAWTCAVFPRRFFTTGLLFHGPSSVLLLPRTPCSSDSDSAYSAYSWQRLFSSRSSILDTVSVSLSLQLSSAGRKL